MVVSDLPGLRRLKRDVKLLKRMGAAFPDDVEELLGPQSIGGLCCPNRERANSKAASSSVISMVP